MSPSLTGAVARLDGGGARPVGALDAVATASKAKSAPCAPATERGPAGIRLPGFPPGFGCVDVIRLQFCAQLGRTGGGRYRPVGTSIGAGTPQQFPGWTSCAPWHSANVYQYVRILRRRAALVPFAAAVTARLPISMAPLGMILLIQDVRGSYSVAGAVTAAFALATSVSAPALGRIMDLVGQPRVIAPTSALSAVLLAWLALAAARGEPVMLLVVLSAGVGLSFPVITPAMRGAWRVVLTSPADRAAAYAMDAVAVEFIFVGGPLLLSALLALTPPQVPLLVTAGLLATGGLAYSFTGAARARLPAPALPSGIADRACGHEPGNPARAGPGACTAGSRVDTGHDRQRNGNPGNPDVSPLRVPGVPAVLLVSLAMAVGFGQLDVSIAATARQTLQDQAPVGLLFAGIAGGSVTGGLWYGARAWRRPERTRLPVALAGFAAGLFVLAAEIGAGGRLDLLLVLLFGTGLCIAPALIIQQSLIDRLAPGHRLGEAQAWLNTGLTAGGAAGSAIGGFLVDTGGPPLSYGGAALAVGVSAMISMVVQRHWNGSH